MSTSESENRDIVRLIMAADSEYALPLAVTVRSAVETTQRPVELIVLDGGLTSAERQRLLDSWSGSRLTVHWLEIDEQKLAHLPVWGRMKPVTYIRLLIAHLTPDDWTRVLWLDSDILVQEDLARLWDLDFDGRLALAARDLVVPYLGSRYGVNAWKELGLNPVAPHFNAGVMLVDLERWRIDCIAEKAVEYLGKHGARVCFFDQEALNAVLVGQWGELDPRWNQIASMAGQPFLDASHLDPAIYKRLVENPFLVHFAGSLKPWKCRRASQSWKPWYEVLDRTAWKDWRPPTTLRSLALDIYANKLRRWLYQLEPWYIAFLRRRDL
jgi:lipopolysaccharide biosynthesis glycosyltransferase